jgi:hypothetical protein
MRLRVGAWRILYAVREREVVVLVLRIGPWGEVYERLGVRRSGSSTLPRRPAARGRRAPLQACPGAGRRSGSGRAAAGGWSGSAAGRMGDGEGDGAAEACELVTYSLSDPLSLKSGSPSVSGGGSAFVSSSACLRRSQDSGPLNFSRSFATGPRFSAP